MTPAAPTSNTRPPAYLDYRLFVPTSVVRQEWLDAYTDVIVDFYDEFDEEGNQRDCRDLALRNYKQGPEWTSFTRGDLSRLHSVFGNALNIMDCRSHAGLGPDWEGFAWKGVLLDDNETYAPLKPAQEKAITDWLRAGCGILEAPPRFGKTVCMVNAATRVGMKTLVIVNQIELAQQFERTLRRNTNIEELEAKSGKKLAGICDKLDDFRNFGIAITTWQIFLPSNSGHAWMDELRNAFGMVLVDEAHQSAAQCFSAAVARFNPTYRLGVTATPYRKDRLEKVVEAIIGPVTARGDEDKTPLRVRPIYTGFTPGPFTQWVYFENQVMRNKARNKLAVKCICEDVARGYSVLVVCVRVAHIEELVNALIAEGVAAEGFFGSAKDRPGVLQRANAGVTKVVVAMRKCLLGINVPLWSSIHILSPSNNPYNHYQEIARVRTAREGKDHAVVRDYMDNHKAAIACWRTRYGVYSDPQKAPICFETPDGTLVRYLSQSEVERNALRSREQMKAEFTLLKTDKKDYGRFSMLAGDDGEATPQVEAPVKSRATSRKRDRLAEAKMNGEA